MRLTIPLTSLSFCLPHRKKLQHDLNDPRSDKLMPRYADVFCSYDMNGPTSRSFHHARFTRSILVQLIFLPRSCNYGRHCLRHHRCIRSAFLVGRVACDPHCMPSPPISFPLPSTTIVPKFPIHQSLVCRTSADIALWIPFQSHCGNKFPAHLFNLRICSIFFFSFTFIFSFHITISRHLPAT